eukprot:4210835-Prorocentrum_lima.AAC.1
MVPSDPGTAVERVHRGRTEVVLGVFVQALAPRSEFPTLPRRLAPSPPTGGACSCAYGDHNSSRRR